MIKAIIKQILSPTQKTTYGVKIYMFQSKIRYNHSKQ
jgi:hypothetical protein